MEKIAIWWLEILKMGKSNCRKKTILLQIVQVHSKTSHLKSNRLYHNIKINSLEDLRETAINLSKKKGQKKMHLSSKKSRMKEFRKRKKSSKKTTFLRRILGMQVVLAQREERALPSLSHFKCFRRWTSLGTRSSRIKMGITSRCSRPSQPNKMHSFSSISINKRRERPITAIQVEIMSKISKISKEITIIIAVMENLVVTEITVAVAITMQIAKPTAVLLELIERRRDLISKTTE